MFLFVLSLKRYKTTEVEAKGGGRGKVGIGNQHIKEVGDLFIMVSVKSG